MVPTPEIATDDVMPPLPEISEDEPDSASQHERAAERAHAEDVLETLDTLIENGITDHETLVRFGRRMASLCYHGGLTPSQSKVKTANDLFGDQTLKTCAELLGMTKGGFSSLLGKASSAVGEGRNLAVERYVNIPVMLLAETTIEVDGVPEGEHRLYLLEAVDPQPAHGIYGAHGPDTAPPDPKYAVVDELWSPDRWTSLSSTDVEIYLEASDLVDDLYEERTFEEIEVAERYHDWLEACGFPVESDPFDRLTELQGGSP